MSISDQALDEFIQLYREEFEKTLTKAHAREIAFRLVTLYELLAKNLPNDNNVTLPNDLPR